MASDLFVQSFKAGGEDVGTQFIVSATYIERMDLSCPKVILQMRDPQRFFQDELNINNGVEIELGLGDAQGRGEELFIDRFIIGASWCEGDIYTIEAMQADIYAIKQPAINPIFFVDKTATEILKEIFPEYELNADVFTVRLTQHVLNGATVSAMLARLAKDIGASIWLARGVLHVKRLSAHLEPEHDFKFEYGVNNSPNPLIHSYERYHPELAQVRKNRGNYIVWDRVKGMLNPYKNEPNKFLSSTNEVHALNHSLYTTNIMDATLAGNGLFSAGQVIKVELTRMTKDAMFDESVPVKQVMLGARHYQQGVKYITVAELGTVGDANI